MKRQRPSLRERAHAILSERGAMHYRDLAEAILAGGYRTKGKTFAQTLSATLARESEFEKVAPGVYAAAPTKEDE